MQPPVQIELGTRDKRSPAPLREQTNRTRRDMSREMLEHPHAFQLSEHGPVHGASTMSGASVGLGTQLESFLRAGILRDDAHPPGERG